MVVVLEDEPRHRDVRGQGRGDVSLCWLKDESPRRKRQEGWGEGQGERGERGGRKSRNTGKEEREEKPRQDGKEGAVRARTGGTGESKSSRKINQKGADDN